VSPANLLDWEKQNHVFERLAFYRSWDATVTGSGEPERLDACQVSEDFFRLLDVAPGTGPNLFGGRVPVGPRSGRGLESWGLAAAFQ
jgi:hypothetical protein